MISALVASAAAFAPPTSLPAHLVPRSSAASTPCAASAAAESAAETDQQPINANTTDNANDNVNAAIFFLDDALKPKSDASQKILDDLAQMRQNNQQLEAEVYLDDLLDAVDDNIYVETFWTRLPGATRLSRRARMASLSRALELSTPPADEEEEGGDDEESEGRRRRRALAVLIRTLSKENEQLTTGRFRSFLARPAIRRIERAAKRGARESATQADMENRIPAGLETPKYDVVVRRKTYEVRHYQPYALATVGMSSKIQVNDEKRSATDAKVSMPTMSGASSFGALAGYLFGKNSQQSSMAMTSPVFTTNAGGKKEEKEMSFVMPSDYWAEDGVTAAPQPLDGSGVRLQLDEGGTRAVVMFGGFASKSDVAKRKEQLLQGLEGDKDYKVKEGSAMTLAQYNDPFTPGWKRRNEVSIDLVPASSSSE